MDSHEFEVWKELYLNHSFGNEDQLLAELWAAGINGNPFREKGAPTATPSMVLPQRPEETQPQTTEEHKAMAEIIVTALGGGSG